MSLKIICPYCGAEQSDCTNGFDAGPWWGDEYTRSSDSTGECPTECDACDKPFTVMVVMEPTFAGVMPCQDD